MVQETQPEQTPFSEEEWAHTPPAVQEFVLALIAHVQELETELSALRERVNRNSRNSSKPPSSDGPDVPQSHASEPRANASEGDNQAIKARLGSWCR